ncbi:MAG: hypothetical protein LBT04_02940 [Prevotellaceae bacterium]|jgi:hypothetical protein|nr:hypothetical protein [Prevotellaceae bacterium]
MKTKSLKERLENFAFSFFSSEKVMAWQVLLSAGILAAWLLMWALSGIGIINI